MFTHRTKHRVGIFGDPNVGKDSLISRLATGYYDEDKSKSFDTRIETITRKNVTMQLIGGGKDSKNWGMMRVDIALILFDITNKASFNNLKKHINTAISRLYAPDENLAIIIVGNKSDLASERKVSKEDIAAFCEEHKYTYSEISVRMRDNVEETLDTAVSNAEAIKEKAAKEVVPDVSPRRNPR